MRCKARTGLAIVWESVTPVRVGPLWVLVDVIVFFSHARAGVSRLSLLPAYVDGVWVRILRRAGPVGSDGSMLVFSRSKAIVLPGWLPSLTGRVSGRKPA